MDMNLEKLSELFHTVGFRLLHVYLLGDFLLFCLVMSMEKGLMTFVSFEPESMSLGGSSTCIPLYRLAKDSASNSSNSSRETKTRLLSTLERYRPLFAKENVEILSFLHHDVLHRHYVYHLKNPEMSKDTILWFPVLDFKDFFERKRSIAKDLAHLLETVHTTFLSQTTEFSSQLTKHFQTDFVSKTLQDYQKRLDIYQSISSSLTSLQGMYQSITSALQHRRKEYEATHYNTYEESLTFEETIKRNKRRGFLLKNIDQLRLSEKHVLDALTDVHHKSVALFFLLCLEHYEWCLALQDLRQLTSRFKTGNVMDIFFKN